MKMGNRFGGKGKYKKIVENIGKRTKWNALMAATAWNLKKLMEILKEKTKQFFRHIFIRHFFIEYTYCAAA